MAVSLENERTVSFGIDHEKAEACDHDWLLLVRRVMNNGWDVEDRICKKCNAINIRRIR